MTHKTTIPASAAHDQLEKLLDASNGGQTHLIVERAGKPVAVMLSFTEYQSLVEQRGWEVFDRLQQALGQEAEQTGLSEEDLQQDIEQHRRDIMRGRYGALE